MEKPRIAKESFKRLVGIKEQLYQNRLRYDSVWRDSARYTNPNMSDWNDQPEQQGGSRPDDVKHIYDTTVQEASNTLANGIQGYSFARNQAWFKLVLEEIGDLSGTESEWLEKSERKSYSDLQKSNFYDEGRSFVKSCADFGTAVMFRIDNYERGIPVYRTQHLKRTLIAENEFGEVDVLFRDFWMTAYEAASMFGKDSLPARIQASYDQGKLNLYKFTQAILPPERYDLDTPRIKAKPFYSIFWTEVDPLNPIQDGGYLRKPFFAWRWSRNLDGEVWGVDSPGMMMTPNIKQLNAAVKDQAMNRQLAVEPPIKATEGMGKISFIPRGITRVRPGQDFTPVPITGRMDGVDLQIAEMRHQINTNYFTDFFLILSQNMEKQKTATEVAGIQGEKAALLSAFYGRLTSEFLEPVLEDLFSLEYEAGRFTKPPESLIGKDLRIDMVSPLAQMQERYLMLGSSQQALAEIFAIAQANPNILDNLDLDVHVRNIADAYGLDKRVVRDMMDVQKLRQARSQAQAQMIQQQQALEQAKVGAQVVNKLPPGQLKGGNQ